jgi:hypothetical protein
LFNSQTIKLKLEKIRKLQHLTLALVTIASSNGLATPLANETENIFVQEVALPFKKLTIK